MPAQPSDAVSPALGAAALLVGGAFISFVYSLIARLSRRAVVAIAAAATVGMTALLWFDVWHLAGSGNVFLGLGSAVLACVSLFAAPAIGVLWRSAPGTAVLRTTARGLGAACACALGVLALYILLAVLARLP